MKIVLARYFRAGNHVERDWLLQATAADWLASLATCAHCHCGISCFRPVPKASKRPNKPTVAKTNGTMEDLRKQLGSKKKTRPPWPPLPSNNSYSNLLDDYALNMNMTHMNESDTDSDSDEHPVYEAAVVYGKTEVILPNLHHFQEYSIEVCSLPYS